MGTSELLILVAVLGCGCAHGGTAAGSGAPNERVVCRMEKVIGSHMRQQVCVSEADRQNQRDGAQRAVRSPMTEVAPIE